MRNFISCFIIGNCANLLCISVADDDYKHKELNASNNSMIGYLYYRLPVQGYTKYHENVSSMFEEVQKSRQEGNICPFEWKVNIQENRFPRILLTVVCKNSVIYEKTEKSHNCQPVFYILPVLTIQSYHFGLPVYKQNWENITISCIPKFSASSKSKVVMSSFITNFRGVLVERESQTAASVEDPT